MRLQKDWACKMKPTWYHTFTNEELIRETDKPNATELEIELGRRLSSGDNRIPNLLQEVLHFPRNEE